MKLSDYVIDFLVNELVESQKPIAVWGAGTHTLRLLKMSSLGRANIVAFLDSNSRYQEKRLLDLQIIAPKRFDRCDVTILISSQVAEAEIKAQIEDELHWPNEVICLYTDSSRGSPERA